MSNEHEIMISLIDAEGLFWLSVTIDGEEHELGRYKELGDAAARARRWVEGRGLVWRWDSARRLSEVQRNDGDVLIMYVVTKGQMEAHQAESRRAWVLAFADHDAYLEEPSYSYWLRSMLLWGDE